MVIMLLRAHCNEAVIHGYCPRTVPKREAEGEQAAIICLSSRDVTLTFIGSFFALLIQGWASRDWTRTGNWFLGLHGSLCLKRCFSQFLKDVGVIFCLWACEVRTVVKYNVDGVCIVTLLSVMFLGLWWSRMTLFANVLIYFYLIAPCWNLAKGRLLKCFILYFTSGYSNQLWRIWPRNWIWLAHYWRWRRSRRLENNNTSVSTSSFELSNRT